MQGVGFRPYVYRLASELGARRLGAERRARGAARGRGPGRGRRGDSWLACAARRPRSPRSSASAASARADRGPAASRSSRAKAGGEPAACLARRGDLRGMPGELFDPADRRHRYPFTNCTNCGPRFTIVRGVPYDRPLTTMAASRCASAAGPSTRTRATAASTRSPTPARSAGRGAAGSAGGAERPARGPARRRGRGAAAPGAFLAVKGIGGFHLACLAADEAAVAALRARKHREDKPFALMAPDLAAARRLVGSARPSGAAGRPRAPDRHRPRAGPTPRWRRRWRPPRPTWA